jgi:hypothetical protein
MRTPTIRAAALAFALALGAAFPAAAQSLLASRGIGFPLDALDARSRGLGGISVGLGGSSLSLVDPAAMAGLPAPAVTVTFQPDWYDAVAGDESTDGSTARFPALQVAFPVSARLSTSFGYGGFLDQHWRVTQTDSIDLSTGRVEVRDRFVSSGAVARLRVGAAYLVSERLGVGVAADVFTGSVRDSSVREIDGLFSAASGTTFRYRGVGFSLGADWRPLDALTVAAAVSRGGDLTASSPDSAEDQEKTYTAPLTLDLGASARVTGNTSVALGARWAGWSAANDELSDAGADAGGARDAVSLSGGVEYEGVSFLGQSVPLRLGGRYARLPFRWGDSSGGAEFPDEKAITGGFGLILARGGAAVDASVERGWRGGDAAGLDESYWRAAFTLRLLAR